MFEYINGCWWCDEYNFYALDNLTYNDIIDMMDKGELE